MVRGASLGDKGRVLLDALEVVGPDSERVRSGGPSLVVVSGVLDREGDLGRERKGEDGGDVGSLGDIDVVGRDGALLAGLGRKGERVVGVVGVELALVAGRLAGSPVGLGSKSVSTIAMGKSENSRFGTLQSCRR